MPNFFDIHTIFFTLWDYPMSYLEFFGVVSGSIATWLAARANVLTWPIAVGSVFLFFFLFYQVQLYPDMFLQVFFFITYLQGWWRWTHPVAQEADQRRELRITRLTGQPLFLTLFGGVASHWFAGHVCPESAHVIPRPVQQTKLFSVSGFVYERDEHHWHVHDDSQKTRVLVGLAGYRLNQHVHVFCERRKTGWYRICFLLPDCHSGAVALDPRVPFIPNAARRRLLTVPTIPNSRKRKRATIKYGFFLSLQLLFL